MKLYHFLKYPQSVHPGSTEGSFTPVYSKSQNSKLSLLGKILKLVAYPTQTAWAVKELKPLYKVDS